MKNKQIIKIFIVTILFALAGGISYNFQELWLQSNGLSVKSIGIILGLCSFIAASVIFLCSNYIKNKFLQKFCTYILLLKFICNMSLFLLNGSNILFLIKFISMIDYALDAEFAICIYPLLSLIKSSDKLYAKNVMIYDGSYSIGILITTLLLGKMIFFIKISYNSYLLIAALLCLISAYVLTTLNITISNTSDSDYQISKVINRVKKEKSIKMYLLSVMTNNISFYSIYNLIFIIFTAYLGYAEVSASNICLLFSIISVILGFIALKYFTFKNSKINIFIKCGIRSIIFFISFILNTKLLMTISIAFMLLTSDLYEDIITAPFINSFSNDNKLAFCNLRNIISYIGVSIGTIISSILLKYGLRYVLFSSAIFMLLTLIFKLIAEEHRKIENDRK